MLKDETGANFPWATPLCPDLDETGKALNETPMVVLLADGLVSRTFYTCHPI
jgi:hypothetical protein